MYIEGISEEPVSAELYQRRCRSDMTNSFKRPQGNHMMKNPIALKQMSDEQLEIKPPTMISIYHSQKKHIDEQYSLAQDQDGDGIAVGADSPRSPINENEEIVDELPETKQKIVNQASQNTELEMKRNKQMGFLKLMNTKKLVKNFLNMVYQRAYMLPSGQQQITDLLKEAYTCNQDTKRIKRKNHSHTPAPIRRGISVILKKIEKKPHKIKIPVIEPESNFNMVWQCVKILVTLLVIWWYPYEVSFITHENESSLVLQSLLITFYCFDILVKFNRGYISQGVIIKQRKQIIRNYISGEAITDIISLVCIKLVFNSGQEIACVLFILVNSRVINTVLIKVQEYFYFQGTVSYIVDLTKLVVVIFSFAHGIACVWNYVGSRYSADGRSWIINQGISHSPTYVKYNYSFYWATMTMVTVGYGDITPTNQIELLVANITMFIACGVFAFSVNSIGIVLQNINEGKKKLKRTLSLINNYMSHNSVESELQSRVRNYLEYCYEEEQQMNDEETSDLLGKLSNSLRSELLYQVLSKVLKDCKVISQNFSEETQKKLSCLMEPLRFSPEDNIINHTEDDCSLFIVQRGEVLLYEESSKKELKILKKGDSFGEIGFFSGRRRVCSAQSHGFSRVYKIKREIFLDLIKDKANEWETFHMIKDQIALHNEYYQAHLKCYCCQSIGHLIVGCPILRFIPDLEGVVKRDMYGMSQDRQSLLRRNKSLQYHQSLVNMKLYQERSRNFKDDSESDADETYTGMVSMKDEHGEPHSVSYLNIESKLGILENSQHLSNNDNYDEVEDFHVGIKRKSNIKVTQGTAQFRVGTDKRSRFGDDLDLQLNGLGQPERRQSNDSISIVPPPEKDLVPRINFVPREEYSVINPQTRRAGMISQTKIVDRSDNRMVDHSRSIYFEEDEVQKNLVRKISTQAGTKLSQSSLRRASSKKTGMLSQRTQVTIKKDKDAIPSVLDDEEEFHEFFMTFEQQKSYKYYLPHNNVDQVIKRYQKIQQHKLRILTKHKDYTELSKYTFFHEIKRRILLGKKILRQKLKNSYNENRASRQTLGITAQISAQVSQFDKVDINS